VAILIFFAAKYPLIFGLIEGLRERTEHLDIFPFFCPSLDAISDVLFTGGRGVSDFSVLKYY